MDDDELAEMRAELEQLREFKRVVMQNFGLLTSTPVMTVPAGYKITDTKQLKYGTIIKYVKDGHYKTTTRGGGGNHE